MGRKSKHNIENKIKACRDYKNGKGSFVSIAKELSVVITTIRICT